MRGSNQAQLTTPRRRIVLFAAWLCALFIPALVVAQSAVPSKLRAAILLRALQYEKAYAAGSGTATIVVLSGTKGAADAAEMVSAMRALGSAGDKGRPFQVKEMSGDVSADALRAAKPAAVYVALGNEGALSMAAGAADALVLCGDPSAVGKGCLLSVEPAGSSSRLVVDLVAAEKAGRTFDARLLRLSRVIR
jgi:hypothetical protein